MSLNVGIALALVIVPFLLFCMREGVRLLRRDSAKERPQREHKKRPPHLVL